MEIYTITPSRYVACIVAVQSDMGARYECMYMAEGKPVECRPEPGSVRQYSAQNFIELPVPVQSSVNQYFGEVFSVPNDGRRGKWVEQQPPFIVHVDRLAQAC